MSTEVIEKFGSCTVRYLGLFNPAIPVEYAEFIEKAATETIKWWRKTIAPGHFLAGAYAKYQGLLPYVYEYRVGKRKRSRRSSTGPDNRAPLVHSGTLRNQFLNGTQNFRYSGQGNHKRVTWWPVVESYAYMFDPNRSQIRYAKHLELTVLNASDLDAVRNQFSIELDKAYQAKAKQGA